MAYREIWHEMIIKASPSELYQALTDSPLKMARGCQNVPSDLDALGTFPAEPEGICRDGQRPSASLRYAGGPMKSF